MRIVKQLAAALTAATLAAGLAVTSASAHLGNPGSTTHTHGQNDVVETVYRAEYSSDSGSTWTSAWITYIDAERRAELDNGDGPDAGVFRRRLVQPLETVGYLCVEGHTPRGSPTFEGAEYVVNKADCAGNPVPHAHNVGGGAAEPSGDWCVAGAAEMICRGEGSTYSEARRALGY